MGRVFNFKLDSFGVVNDVHGTLACTHLMLKTRPRFRPVGLSLSMAASSFRIRLGYHKTRGGWEASRLIHRDITTIKDKNFIAISQGILKWEVSLYH
jgi:hypothetical protein